MNTDNKTLCECKLRGVYHALASNGYLSTESSTILSHYSARVEIRSIYRV